MESADNDTMNELVNVKNTMILLCDSPSADGAADACLGRRKGARLMLIYHCPTTGRVVRSDIETSEAEVRRLSALRFSLWCPYCQTGHGILGKDTKIATDIGRPAA